MKSITPMSFDKMDKLASTVMKTCEEVARHEMMRAGIKPEEDPRAVYDNFKTMILLFMSATINKSIESSNAILMKDFKTESKDERSK